ncbi:pyridoxamine 5'-phosphate oxidase family protein [Streptomyces johnsoniae]|uniref:Pyridoxamine 5'-phosphate oxidase family protein n=1 Tax=Streptomyces johnsoniae TaxID=3075532 RepID=A0ABU2S6H6_9ACTN|nr:pyridoxamine 5'-phosphate oxidase family protein [Streptomyces sp. DSM 41886]MDT0444517.1 pyridoxamine 5'-phosphate oxidase family protein [Streptomyces sp. DSM 41886]
MRVKAVDGRVTFPQDAPFDVEGMLAQPLTARVATPGPVVRPVWYLWEASAFWVFIGPWSRLLHQLPGEPAFDLVVDVCDVHDGTVRQIRAHGRGFVEPFDVSRARRKLVRYLGPDESRWDPRFSLAGDTEARGLRLARLAPEVMSLHDMSFRPSVRGTAPGGGPQR